MRGRRKRHEEDGARSAIPVILSASCSRFVCVKAVVAVGQDAGLLFWPAQQLCWRISCAPALDTLLARLAIADLYNAQRH